MREKAVSLIVDVLEDALAVLGDYAKDKTNEIIQEKIVKPIDLLRERTMYGVALLATSLAGFLLVMFGAIMLAAEYIKPWMALVAGGVVLLLISRFFSSKLKATTEKAKEL